MLYVTLVLLILVSLVTQITVLSFWSFVVHSLCVCMSLYLQKTRSVQRIAMAKADMLAPIQLIRNSLTADCRLNPC